LINVTGTVIEYDSDMAKANGSGRARGHIRRRGRSFQVLVYAGVDPVTGKPHRLTASTTDEKQAHRILRRFIHQLDEQTHARTNATFGDAVDAWLRVHEVDANTAADYEAMARLYIKPGLGNVPLSRITAQSLEQFYADLRRCRVRCDGQPFVEHRAVGEHECRMIRHRRPPGRPPAKGYPAHDCDRAGCALIECPTHVCRPLTPARIRKVHFTVSAVLSAAVRWEWIKSNPADVARKPRQTPAQPDPPSLEEAARIVAAAWDQDDGWGTLVWLTMVTGMRRGELLALRWHDVDLDAGMLEIRRNYVWGRGQGIEKDTKTHQMRRIALDMETVEILRAHRARYEAEAAKLGIEPNNEAFVFSYEPAHDRPCNPHGVSHRYSEMCAALSIDSHLHALRHYSATELLTAGVDLRTVAGRLGHGGGGATTLRVYAAWVSASDRRAAEILGGRVKRPARPRTPGTPADT
jgi:integrase